MLANQETTIVWRDLTAKVKDKQIISNCSGYCEPGSMLAIMGPSGAGKTTLLSMIAMKQSKALNTSGKVWVCQSRSRSTSAHSVLNSSTTSGFIFIRMTPCSKHSQSKVSHQ